MSTRNTMSREYALEQVQRNPSFYSRLRDDHRSDHEICLATLMAFDRYRDDYDKNRTIESVFWYVPNFSEHKTVFLKFVDRGDSDSIKIYLKHFGLEIYSDRIFLKEAMALDRYACLFRRLPIELRSDLDLLMTVVEPVLGYHCEELVSAIPPAVLKENEFVLFRIMEKPDFYFSRDVVPHFFWKNRNFILKWANKQTWVSLQFVEKKLFEDREIYLVLCRRCCKQISDIVKLIPKVFLTDKEFVLECLIENSELFAYCHNDLQRDFDVVLVAAFGSLLDVGKDFSSFIDRLGGSLVSFACLVHKRMTAHDEFMTLLACWFKSRQILLVRPLSVLDCDEETARGLQTVIAKYLDCTTKDNSEHLKRVWDGFVQEYITKDALPPAVVQLIQPHVLVRNVLTVIKKRHPPVVLKKFPDELWTHRTFVLWAAQNGIFCKAIRADFSHDPEICLAYYEHSATLRQKIMPWISHSLKSDRSFVLKCVNSGPLILAHCTNDDILYDYEILLNVANHAADYNHLDSLPEIAVAAGWAGPLVFFAKSLRAKMEALDAFKSFHTQMRNTKGLSKDVVTKIFKERIGGYLGVSLDENNRIDSTRIWNNRSIFHLALGGSINDLCEAARFRPVPF